MTAGFFLKKWSAIVLLGILVFSCVLYAGILRVAKRVYIGKNFYFLVHETEHVEADALDIRLDGGAGYPLHGEGVALAVYLKEEDGLAVQAGLIEQGEKTSLVKRSVECLYFKTRLDKEKASLYTGALEGLYGFLQVLSEEISRLDKGTTQQSCRRVLQTLADLFSYHRQEYESVYPAYARLCGAAKEGLSSCMDGTIFVNDLRYMLCDLSVGYLSLAEEFIL